jgi:lactoylglutathione lyase
MNCKSAVLPLMMFTALVTLTAHAVMAESPGEFARTTIDVGMVVGNAEASVKFYTEAIGFQEAPGFSVPGDFSTDLGITDGKPLKIRVLVLGEGPTATRLKVLEIPGAGGSPADNARLDAQLGFRYLTVFVTDGAAAIERLRKAGVKSLGKAPVTLALPNLPRGLEVSFVKDPDGNFVELVAPKK